MLELQRKRKLLWDCRRGMLELDLILQAFLERRMSSLSEQELSALECLLDYTDPQIYAWLMEQDEPTDKALKKIVADIRDNH